MIDRHDEHEHDQKLGSVGEPAIGYQPRADKPRTDILLTLDQWLRWSLEPSAVLIFVATVAVALWLIARAFG